MIRRLAMLAVAAGSLAQPALAAPWTIEADGGLFNIQSASQTDSTGAYRLVYDCSSALGTPDHSLSVVEQEPWDATADYAPEVPTTFEVDGTSRSVDFSFAERAGTQSIALYEDPFDDGDDDFFKFVSAAMEKDATILVRYFDRDLTFSGEGAREGLNHVTLFC